ncbi:hypothetical protein Prudu_005529 [Prunus dulcis]|uniref:FAR1 domain-containing protein n=1 Tax=Prunus dulcis TaxID=3755 RepID=A0A4Y1QXT1_PRUDU|nr:hypothetical protein Prudu_005529 [Prunus dulcis]
MKWHEGSGKMDRGVETSNGGCSDSGDDNDVDMIAPRKEDVMGKEFKTIELAEEYYMSYAKGIGFSVKRQIGAKCGRENM